MKIGNYQHIPVLLQEVIALLNPQNGQNFIDATLGGGGYSRQILEKIGSQGKLLSVDLDSEAIENFQFLISNFQIGSNSKIYNLKSIILARGNFAQIDHIVRNHKFPSPDGIVADLGLSSFHLDQSGRGFSFQKNELLDMRFDRLNDLPDARFIVNNYGDKKLARIFRDYGEEKFSVQIVRAIIRARQKAEIKYTNDLFQIIQTSLPKPFQHKAADSARRIFQALRIEVNHELENLETFLQKAFDLLNPTGRLVVVTFHSLEDRIVKQFFLKLSKGCVCPPDFPQCVCGKNPLGKILTKKPIIPTIKEQEENSRSKSAKLRGIQKI